MGTATGRVGASRMSLLDELGLETRGPVLTEPLAAMPRLRNVPVRVSVQIPMPAMTLRRLHKLMVGEVVASEWSATEEVALKVFGVTVSWCEFASSNGRIAARLTRLG